MSVTVRAAVCREFSAPLLIEKVSLKAPGPDEVRVALEACAVCHSDISYADGLWGGDLPAVWGHEAVGQIVEVGPGVDLEPGRRVVVTLIRSCGTCHYCQRGQRVACTTTFPLDEASPLSDYTGGSIAHGLRTAAFAEQVVVHRSQVVGISDELPAGAAALLACGVITGVGSVLNTAQVEPGSTVVVVGCGGVGLNVVQGAKLAGSSVVVAVDLEPSKLDVAARLGATHTIDPSKDDVVPAVAQATDARMADYVFVAVGSRSAMEKSYDLVGPMGALVLVGMPATGVVTEIDPGTVAARNQRILGSKMGTSTIDRDIPALVSAYCEGRLELDELISGTFSLDQINQALDEVRAGTALRNVIVFDRNTQ